MSVPFPNGILRISSDVPEHLPRNATRSEPRLAVSARTRAPHSRRSSPSALRLRICGFSLCPCSGTTVGSGSRTPGSHSEVACWDPSPAATVDQRNNSKAAVKKSGGRLSIGPAHCRLDSVPGARKQIRLVTLELGRLSPGGRRAPAEFLHHKIIE